MFPTVRYRVFIIFSFECCDDARTPLDDDNSTPDLRAAVSENTDTMNRYSENNDKLHRKHHKNEERKHLV